MNLFIKAVKRILHFFKQEPVLTGTAGAAAISALFNPPSDRYFSFIDEKVLLCLFCLMIVVAGFKKQGAFEVAAAYVAQKSSSLRGLVLGNILLTFFMAMLMTNDVALITLVPFTLVLLDRISETRYSILIIVLQTIAANIGSSLTPVGNPQNLFLFSRYHLKLLDFILLMLPVVAAGGILLSLSVLLIEKKHVSGVSQIDASGVDGRKLIAFALLFVASLLGVFNVLPIAWVFVFLLLFILFSDKHLLLEVDYSLLFTFIGFFIFVGNLSAIPQVKNTLFEWLKSGEYWISLAASQIISNVPAAILLSGFTENCGGLILGVNVGGLGTLVASLASVISYKFFTRAHPKLSGRYIKIFTVFNVLFLFALSLVAAAIHMI